MTQNSLCPADEKIPSAPPIEKMHALSHVSRLFSTFSPKRLLTIDRGVKDHFIKNGYVESRSPARRQLNPQAASCPRSRQYADPTSANDAQCAHLRRRIYQCSPFSFGGRVSAMRAEGADGATML
jgi:hypothetical protein